VGGECSPAHHNHLGLVQQVLKVGKNKLVVGSILIFRVLLDQHSREGRAEDWRPQPELSRHFQPLPSPSLQGYKRTRRKTSGVSRSACLSSLRIVSELVLKINNTNQCP
jgi:hypothetical protein